MTTSPATPAWAARMDDPDVVLGAHVNAFRGFKRVNQTELGEAIGVGQTTMGKKLRGEVGISFAELLLLAEYFEVAVEDLIPPAYAGQPRIAQRARRDSNPKPSDWEPAVIVGGRSTVKPRLTPNLRVTETGRVLSVVAS